MAAINNKDKLNVFEKVCAAIFAVFVRLWIASLRFEYSEEDRRTFSKEGSTAVYIWHNKIIFTVFLKLNFRKRFPMCGLVSPSKDGAYLSEMFKYFGVTAIRGSSYKRGAVAIKELFDVLKDKKDICITPDGPRGPKYKFNGTTLGICERQNPRLFFIRIYPKSCWQLKSWDGFLIPKPFSKSAIKSVNFNSYKDFASFAEKSGLAPEEFAQVLLGSDNMQNDKNEIAKYI